jgi:hypothetical protein
MRVTKQCCIKECLYLEFSGPVFDQVLCK